MTRYLSSGLWSIRLPEPGVPDTPGSFVFSAAPIFSLGAAAIVRVGDRDGRLIGQLFGMLEPVVWRADGYGTATLIIPAETVTDYPYLFNPGNRVRVDFENGLPAWGGVMDVPAETDGRTVRLQLYEAAYTLSWALSGRSMHFGGEDGARVTAVQVADQIMSYSRHFTAPHVIYDDTGEAVTVSFAYENILSALSRLRSLDAALHFHGRLDESAENEILFKMDIFRQGIADDTARAVFRAGHNLVNVTAVDGGPLVNTVIVATGDAALDPDEETPPVVTEPIPYSPYQVAYLHGAYPGELVIATATDSAGLYDDREQFVVLSDVMGAEDPGRAVAHAISFLDKHKKPTRRINGTSLNMEPGAWRNVRVGGLVTVEQPLADSVWQRQTMMILGMDYVPSQGTLQLVFSDPIEGMVAA